MSHWYYISFADKVFHGGIYWFAPGPNEAVLGVTRAGLNPGGEALILGPITQEDMKAHVPEANRRRLLRADEVNQ